MIEDVKQMLDQASEKLAALAHSGQVIGEPIEAGGSAVVPLCELKLGLVGGGGGGEGEGEDPEGQGQGKGKAEGGGAGGYAKVQPVALLVLEPGGARIEMLD